MRIPAPPSPLPTENRWLSSPAKSGLPSPTRSAKPPCSPRLLTNRATAKPQPSSKLTNPSKVLPAPGKARQCAHPRCHMCTPPIDRSPRQSRHPDRSAFPTPANQVHARFHPRRSHRPATPHNPSPPRSHAGAHWLPHSPPTTAARFPGCRPLRRWPSDDAPSTPTTDRPTRGSRGLPHSPAPLHRWRKVRRVHSFEHHANCPALRARPYSRCANALLICNRRSHSVRLEHRFSEFLLVHRLDGIGVVHRFCRLGTVDRQHRFLRIGVQRREFREPGQCPIGSIALVAYVVALPPLGLACPLAAGASSSCARDRLSYPLTRPGGSQEGDRCPATSARSRNSSIGQQASSTTTSPTSPRVSTPPSGHQAPGQVRTNSSARPISTTCISN